MLLLCKDKSRKSLQITDVFHRVSVIVKTRSIVSLWRGLYFENLCPPDVFDCVPVKVGYLSETGT